MDRRNIGGWPMVSAILLLIPACSPPDPIPLRLEERLKSIADMESPNLSRDEVQQALVRQLRVAPVPATRGGNPSHPVFPTHQTLETFYAGNGHRLAWGDDSGHLLPSSRTLLDAMRRADEHGLDTEDYALSRLEHLAAGIGKAPFDDAAVARLADFDLLMTSAFLRYASDLSTGRVHPDEIRSDWHTNPPELDPLKEIGEALESDHLPELLAALPPPHAGYARLRAALKQLRALQSVGGWATIPAGPTLEPGSRGPRVALLRQRLSEPGGEADPFDASLAEVVRRFQKGHGIEPDGKVGPGTRTELNVPIEQRIRQVELNLERWRWIPRRLGDPHILVNIPGFDLELIRDGASSWRTRIVAGKAYSPTPVFSDRIVAVVVNPAWNVPESIAREEYLPALRKDPETFARDGFRLLEGSGAEARVVDPRTVDLRAWDGERFPYRIRQDSGPNNALGRLKFHLTNDYQIYLHDTPARSLFDRWGRDLSHGCIRVEQPLELAARILGESSLDLLRAALERHEERHLPVQPQVAIHILYLTAWVDPMGDLRFAPDVYAFDAPQGMALDRVASRVSGGPASGAREATRPPVR